MSSLQRCARLLLRARCQTQAAFVASDALFGYQLWGTAIKPSFPPTQLKQQHQIQWPLSLRLFCSISTETRISAEQQQLAQAILEHAAMGELKERLSLEGKLNPCMTYDKFIDFCKESGAASTDAEAEDVCTALHKAGVVLRVKGNVYLNAQEVTNLVLQVLPQNGDDAERKLHSIQDELTALEAEHSLLNARAKRMANFLLISGFLYAAAHIAVFVYCTYWEFSWDVMEPIAYIVGLVYSWLAYAYFLTTKGHVMDLTPVKEYWFSRSLDKYKRKSEFNDERYMYLQGLQKTYKKFAKVAKP